MLDDPQGVLDELLRSHFRAFAAKAFSELHGDQLLADNWHIDAMAKVLEDVEESRTTQLLVTMPPRNLKSFLISVAWPAWILGRDPTHKFVCASYSNELSAKFARDCLQVIQSGWYRRIFPGTRISRRHASYDFQTTRNGGRLATSTGGTLVGRGGGTIIVDDPLKADEAMSEAARGKVNNWFRSTLLTRLDDKRSGAIIVVMQRLHEDDLAGVLLEAGAWDHLNLPAIAIEDSTIPLTRGKLYRRREGEVLHARREPLEVLEKIKTGLGSAHFSAQYQQQPVPAVGNIVQASWIRRYKEPLKPQAGDMVVQSWDTASKEGVQHDYSACITAIVRKKRVYVIDVFRDRLSFPKLRRKAIRLAQEHRAEVLLIEDAASGAQLIQDLRHDRPEGVPRPIARTPEGDKITRLDAQSAKIEAGMLLLPDEAPWLADFEHELLGFPNARHDDQVDAAAQLLEWVGTRREQLPPEGGFIISLDEMSDEEILNSNDPDLFRDDEDGIPPELYGWIG